MQLAAQGLLERCEKGLLSVAVIYSIIYFSITSLRAAVCSLNIAQHSLTGSSGYSLICLAVLVIPAPLAAVGLGGSLLFFVGLWVALGLWKGGGIHRGRCTCAHRLSAVSILTRLLGRLAGIIDTKLFKGDPRYIHT